VRYLSCEEVNIRRNDQESRVYKEESMIGMIKENREKIRVKVIRAKVVEVRKGKNEGEKRKEERVKTENAKERREVERKEGR